MQNILVQSIAKMRTHWWRCSCKCNSLQSTLFSQTTYLYIQLYSPKRQQKQTKHKLN